MDQMTATADALFVFLYAAFCCLSARGFSSTDKHSGAFSGKGARCFPPEVLESRRRRQHLVFIYSHKLNANVVPNPPLANPSLAGLCFFFIKMANESVFAGLK